MRHPFGIALLLAAAATASADVVTMKDGRVLEGNVLEDDGKVIKLKMKKGAMTLDHKDIESIVEKPTPEEEYAERVKKLDAGSAAAQLELGRWAGGKELSEEALRHLLEAYRLDPALEGVAAELEKLDYHLVDGVWAPPDVYYPTIGYIKFDGRWCSPAEHAYRMAQKDALAKQKARDDAKEALEAGQGQLKKIEAKAKAEQGTIDKLSAQILKSEAGEAAALKKQREAEDKVKALGEKVAALALKEKPKEGEEAKEPSQALKSAEKALAAARAGMEKEVKAVEAARKAVTDQKAERTAAEKRLAALEKEKGAAESGIGDLEEGVRKAQTALEEANASAAKLKEAWEQK
jgi:hypothetical protein